MAQKGLSKGIANFLLNLKLNEVGICDILKSLPGHLTLESLDTALSIVQAKTTKPDALKIFVNWLKYKDSNPWVLNCLCYPLSSM